MSNMFSLEGKIALVTGASYGIGFAIACAMSDAGATIVFNDIKQELVDKGIASYAEKGIKAHGYVCDVTDEAAVNALVAKIEEEVGVIDILVNNAGIIKRIPMCEMTAEQFRQVIDVDLNAPFIVSKAVIPSMIKKGHGKIINICSMMSELGRETVSAYAAAKGGLKMLPVVLLIIHTLITIIPGPAADAFGGMYHNQPIQSIVKSILSVGTLIVFLMAHEWMRRPDTAIKQGEFYVLTLSTLLGMYFMISAGHFLMFFIGLETASIPMAALVAFDKYRHHSAEAGAKYILTALFSSGLLLYGLSLIYGSVGTLYFADIPARLDGNPLQIMAFVFFFSGMGFKISLVPFHLWTADVYEGAPSTVTAYLSVISKGAAAFVLMTILYKVFAPMVAQWQEVLYWVIIASITLANLFALRQENLKRLMAFSSISQAGYIMLGVISGTSLGMTSLVYYVLI